MIRRQRMPMNEQAIAPAPGLVPPKPSAKAEALANAKNPGDGEQSTAPMTPLKTQMAELSSRHFISSFILPEIVNLFSTHEQPRKDRGVAVSPMT
jgi:hypothetical protein